jgi:hypothetical protein
MDVPVSTYLIKLKNKKGDLKTNLFLHETVFGENKTFIDIFESWLKSLPTDIPEYQEGQEEAIKKYLRYKELPTRSKDKNNDYISGFINIGVCDGTSAKLIHSKTKEEVDKTPEHFEDKQYFYLLAVPKEERFGVLMLSRYSHSGIWTLFKTDLHGYLQAKHNDFVFNAESFISDKAIQNYKNNGSVKKVTLYRYEKSLTLRDADKESMKPFQVITKTEIQLPEPRKKKNEKPPAPFKLTDLLPKVSFLDKDKKKITGDLTDKESSFVSIEGLDQEYEDIYITLEMDGRSKTVRLQNEQKNFHPVYLVKSVISKDGTMDYASIDEQAKELYKGLMSDADFSA